MNDLFVFAATKHGGRTRNGAIRLRTDATLAQSAVVPRALAAGASQARGSAGLLPSIGRLLWLPELTAAAPRCLLRLRCESRANKLKTALRSSFDRRLERLREASATSVTKLDFARPRSRCSGIDGGSSCSGSGSAAPACARWSRRCELCVSSDCCETRCQRPSDCNVSRVKSPASSAFGACPSVRYVECVEVPFLWCAGRRPTIVLPMRLVRQLDDQSTALILAHELAHLRRRDHWVRAVELFVLTIYWWNPLVWVIRRQIHQAEDLCCDAWVRWAFPECTRRYAEVVLRTAESLKSRRTSGRGCCRPVHFCHTLSLKARIEMILESRFAPRLSSRSMVVVALFATLVVPSFIQTTEDRSQGRLKQ